MTVSKAKLSSMTDQVLSDVWRPSSEDSLPGHFDVLRDLVGRISYAFANTTEMTATLEADRADGQIAIKLDDYTLWVWKDGDTTTADSTHIAPTDVGVGAGRWTPLGAESGSISFAALPVGSGFPGDTTDTQVAGATSVQWALSLISRVHMDSDVTGFPAALSGGALVTDLETAVNAIRTPIHNHFVEAGGPAATGSHWHADSTNDAVQAAAPNATDLTTSIALLVAYRNAYNAHRTQSQVHFHDDTTAALAYSPATPVTLSDAITAFNALLSYAIAHGSKIGAAQPPDLYAPNPTGNWAGTPPDNVQSALDRLATLVKTLNSGTAIP